MSLKSFIVADSIVEQHDRGSLTKIAKISLYCVEN